MWWGNLPTNGLVFGKYHSHSIGDSSSAGHFRPEGGAWLVNLREPIELRHTASNGIHGFKVLLSNPV